MGLIVQEATLQTISVGAVRPASTRWQISLRMQYSWNAPGKMDMSLREIGIAVALITPNEFKIERRLLCASQTCSSDEERTWLSALHGSKDCLVSTDLSVFMSSTPRPQDNAAETLANCRDGQSPLEAYIERWVRSLAGKRKRQCFCMTGLVLRSGYTPAEPWGLAFCGSLRFESYVCGQARSPTNLCTLLTVGEYIVLWDGKWLWLYHAESKSIFPCRAWSAPLTSITGGDCIAGSTGVLRIRDRQVSYYPVIRDLRMRWEASSTMACLIEQTSCANSGVDVLLWMSKCGEIWRTRLEDCRRRTASVPVRVDNVPPGWGMLKLWCVPDEMWTSWSTQNEPSAKKGHTNWVSICGASVEDCNSGSCTSSFNLLVERLCLCTESCLSVKRDALELVTAAEELCSGDVTLTCEVFKGGIVCVSNSGCETKALCASRNCRETWLSAPAGRPIYNARGERCAYVDRGGHIVFVCLRSRSAFSKRIAIPSLHSAELMQCSIDVKGERCDVIVTAHSNILGSAWRPNSSPACPLQLHDSRWVLVYPRVPYLTCCTWSGDILWCLELPIPARCLLNGENSHFWVGTVRGIFKVDAQSGVMLDCLQELSAVELSGYKTASGAWTLAGKNDAYDHFIISVMP